MLRDLDVIKFGLKAALWRIPRRLFNYLSDVCWRMEMRAADRHTRKNGQWR